MNDASECPTLRDGDEEVARQWAAGALPSEEAAEFEAHLRTCAHCQRAVERAAGVTAALRSAAASHVKPEGQWRRTVIPIAIVAALVLLTLSLRACVSQSV